MNFTFDNQVLRGRIWEGDARYLADNENPVLGKLYLSTTSFTFRRPADKQGWPFLGGNLPASVGAISVKDGCVMLKSTKGNYCFELFPSSAKSLQQWVHKKEEAMNVVARISNSFLGCYDAYPHPFVETHKGKDVNKELLFQYLGECVPVLKEPINWGLDDVTIRISDEKTEICIGKWKYSETRDFISIDCHIYEAGFFDDSESEFEFHYKISYLGSGTLSKYRWKTDNEKLNHKFKADKLAYPKSNGSEDFIAQNPFELNGFYRIKWSLRYN